jgi:hypothetical protein
MSKETFGPVILSFIQHKFLSTFSTIGSYVNPLAYLGGDGKKVKKPAYGGGGGGGGGGGVGSSVFSNLPVIG